MTTAAHSPFSKDVIQRCNGAIKETMTKINADKDLKFLKKERYLESRYHGKKTC